MISSSQTLVVNQINERIKDREEAMQFYLEKIVVLDNKKTPYDDIISEVDANIVDTINEANNRILDKRSAYQARIDSPCRTDLFWRIIGITSTTTTTPKGGKSESLTYELECTKSSPNGYKPIVIFQDETSDNSYSIFLRNAFGLSYDYDDGTVLQRITPNGIEENDVSEFSWSHEKENFYGAKYYDEPLTRDVFDTFVSSFIGVVGSGSSIITVVENNNYDVPEAQNAKIGDVIVANKTGVIGILPDSSATIIGIGTTPGTLDENISLIQAVGSANVTDFSIYSIDVINQGGGYSVGSEPTVYIEPPGNVGASATAIVSAAGSISAATLTNAGTGYTVAPTVTIVSPAFSDALGFGQTGSLGAIVGIETVSIGLGYQQIPTVTFDDPITFTFNSNSDIDAGTDTITFGSNHPYAEDTRLRYNVGTGNVEGDSFGLTDQTIYFVRNPTSTTIQLSATQGGSIIDLTTTVASEFNFFQGITATAITGIDENGSIGITTIVESGSGYDEDPDITFSSTGIVTATATASISGGSITTINVTNPGTGYTFTSPPEVIISQPLNVGAAATAIVSLGGTILSIDVTNPGAGYFSAPSVTVIPPFGEGEVLPFYQIDELTQGSASYPEEDGSAVVFTVLKNPLSFSSSSVSQALNTNPFSPVTIGIMDSSTIGIGTYIELNNSGISSYPRSWRPELKRNAYPDANIPAITEPKVGADHTFHNIGFNYAPITDPTNPTSYASVGDRIKITQNSMGLNSFSGSTNVITGSFGSFGSSYSLESFVSTLSSCTSEINTSLSNAISASSSAISELQSKETEINAKIAFSNSIRSARDEISLEIHSLRSLLGELEREIRQLKNSLRYTTTNIGITTYNTGNNLNTGINTSPVNTYSVGQVQINAY